MLFFDHLINLLQNLSIVHGCLPLFFCNYSGTLFVPPAANTTEISGIAKGTALCRGSGCPRKTSFLSFCLPPQAASKKKKEKLGTPQTPAGRPLHPFQDVFKWYWPQAARKGYLNSYKLYQVVAGI